MKKLLVILIFSSTLVFAQSAGNTGLSFLKFGFGARNMAMGDIGVVSADDVSAINYNPALLVNYSTPQIMLTHNEWITDVRSEVIGVSFSLWGLPIAAGFNSTSVSDIEVRTRPGEAESTFNANYFYGSFSTGFYLIDDLSFGMTIKYISENQFTDVSNGYGFDLGLNYSGLYDGLNIGASIKNLGSMNEFRNEETKLPVDLRVGISYLFNLESINSEVLVGSGVQKYLDTDDTHYNFGGEFLYDQLIAVRLGYMVGYESKGITAGMGLIWDKLNFDYAFVPYDYDLGNSHIISVKYTF